MSDSSGAVAHQAPPSMGFPRQEYWSGCLLQGTFLTQKSEPLSPVLAGEFFITELPGKHDIRIILFNIVKCSLAAICNYWKYCIYLWVLTGLQTGIWRKQESRCSVLLGNDTLSCKNLYLGVQIEAGQRITEFCQENSLIVANTFFQQHKRWLYTWTNGQHWNQIDYICSQRWSSCIQSAKTRPGVDCGSDYVLLIVKFRLKLRKVGKLTRPFGIIQWKWQIDSRD